MTSTAEILLAAAGTIVVLITLQWRMMSSYAQRLTTERVDCESRSRFNMDGLSRRMLTLSDSVIVHHDNKQIHRDPEREAIQFKRIEDLIQANKETVTSQQMTVSKQIDEMRGEIRELTKEIKRHNGNK